MRLSLFASTSPSLFLLDMVRDLFSKLEFDIKVFAAGSGLFEDPGPGKLSER